MRNLRYASTIDEVARLFQGRDYPSDDPTLDALIHLALAFRAMQRLKEKQVDLTFQNCPLVIPSIIKAYRELIFIRSRLQVSWLLTDIISKFGKIMIYFREENDCPHLD